MEDPALVDPQAPAAGQVPAQPPNTPTAPMSDQEAFAPSTMASGEGGGLGQPSTEGYLILFLIENL
jgi:hypothetical protein